MSVPLCWRGCGRPATPTPPVLSCDECAAAHRARHEAIQATRQAEYARDVNEANQKARGSRYVPCARCGAAGTVLARWARHAEIEAERKAVERRIAPAYGSEAFSTSIALTAPAGNFDGDDMCPACTRAKYDATFYGD